MKGACEDRHCESLNCWKATLLPRVIVAFSIPWSAFNTLLNTALLLCIVLFRLVHNALLLLVNWFATSRSYFPQHVITVQVCNLLKNHPGTYFDDCTIYCGFWILIQASIRTPISCLNPAIERDVPGFNVSIKNNCQHETILFLMHSTHGASGQNTEQDIFAVPKSVVPPASCSSIRWKMASLSDFFTCISPVAHSMKLSPH